MKTKINSPKVSVIIPTYLRSKFLSKAIKSVLSQTLKEFEVIVVNDSDIEDDTIKVLKKFNDKRIKYIRNTRTKGANGARNTGILKAKGKYIAILDDDDIFLPAKLEKQFDFLENNPDIGLVSTQAFVIDDNDKVVRSIDNDFNSEDIFYNLIFNNCIVHCSVMIRKNIIAEAGYYDEGLNQAQDYDLWSRLIRITKFSQINEKLVQWREHPASITGRKLSFQKLSSIYLARENLLRFAKKEISPVTISKLQDKVYKNIFELKEAIPLFQVVLKKGIRENNLSARKYRYSNRLLKTAMYRNIELSLYSFFIKRPKKFFITDFLALPLPAKKILIKKLILRVMRIFNFQKSALS